MWATTKLVSELVRAANRPEQLTNLERQGLFLRTIVMVQNMRKLNAIPATQKDCDLIVELQAQLAAIGTNARTPGEMRDALLLAAGMIRELHILLTTGAEE